MITVLPEDDDRSLALRVHQLQKDYVLKGETVRACGASALKSPSAIIWR